MSDDIEGHNNCAGHTRGAFVAEYFQPLNPQPNWTGHIVHLGI